MVKILPTGRPVSNVGTVPRVPAHEVASAEPGRARWISVRIAGAVAIALALALLPYRAIDSDSLAMLARMKSDVASATDKLQNLREENDVLRREITSLRDDSRAIEEVARRDLGMIRPDEVIVRVGGGAAAPLPPTRRVGESR